MAGASSRHTQIAATVEEDVGTWRNGSILIERYLPAVGRPQWLLYIVKDGSPQLLRVFATRHDALVHAEGIRG